MVSTPELKKYMERKVLIQLNGSRSVVGVLRGYDLFLNVVLEDAIEMGKKGVKFPLGSGQTVIRGNSILSLEPLESLS
ncbi:HDL484Wp [Eremothecium sinecaudum]|uniref:Small nuclear ribonucleoprotein G n=1 Tax=Eremothecium sinecaudum TaxID=45286 RepID=A0A0X8HRR2_9SACH|nr:HDL484Wp [Eremothecium sinecaudum]AMD20260.1 HDL484Wp [Eremothecium sinecaudum]